MRCKKCGFVYFIRNEHNKGLLPTSCPICRNRVAYKEDENLKAYYFPMEVGTL